MSPSSSNEKSERVKEELDRLVETMNVYMIQKEELENTLLKKQVAMNAMA